MFKLGERLDYVPEGFEKLDGVLTTPIGYQAYWNVKSLFGGEYQMVFVKEVK